MGFLRLLVFATGLFLAPALAWSGELYRWNGFIVEPHLEWVRPGKFSNQAQIRLLIDRILAAREVGARIPPGVQARLGELFENRGDLERARTAYEQEKRSYPESAVLMDRMIERLGK